VPRRLTICRLCNIEVPGPALDGWIAETSRFAKSHLVMQESWMRVVLLIIGMWCSEREGELVLRWECHYELYRSH
jgi:hypothetical protein